ncbi:MAG: MopE-related protein [Sedimentisphaerales bacterium]
MKKAYSTVLLISLLVIFSSAPVTFAIPSNDNCADAAPVGNVTNLPFNTTGATHDGAGSCMYSPNIWYCYTATCNGTVTVSLCGSSYDTMVAVYNGCSCNLGTPLACNDDYCGLQSYVTFSATAGNTYLIEIGGYKSNTGLGVLSISCETLPNDNCANAEPVGNVTNLPFDTTTATADGPGGCMSSADIWYCYTATCNETVTVSLCGSSYDTKVAVYNGCSCNPFGERLVCNDDYCGLQSYVTFPAVEGNSYLIQVGGYASNTGLGVLSISCGVEIPCACCLNGTCMDSTIGSCAAQGGISGGAGTSCATYTCPAPETGACCDPMGYCYETTQGNCYGIWYGAGTTCASVSCQQQMMGACCFPDGSCMDLMGSECTDYGGMPAGPGTTCATYVCPQPCTPHFFANNILPPLNGRYNCESSLFANYASGILIRNWSTRAFTAGVVPPPPGSPVTHNFGSQVEFEISFNDGTTYTSITANAANTMQIAYQSSSGGEDIYQTEMLQMDISGGGLPPSVMIRESPTLVSAGQTHIKPIPGGYMICSFFDIYTEISTDNGGTWMPVSSPAHVELKVDPAFYPPVAAPRTVLPMPNGEDASLSGVGQAYASGIVIKDIRHKLFTDWMEPPLFGASNTHTFDSQLDFQFSTDGGLSFTAARAPATVTETINHTRDFQGRATYETEVTQLDISGGDLPAGVMIRESPTKVSEGGVSMLAGGGGGGAAISSFFDIFTEVSTDGGVTWGPATSGPEHLELERVAPVYTYANNLWPPLSGEYLDKGGKFAFYADGIVITNVHQHIFTAAISPPLPGITTSHTFGEQVDLEVSYDGGLTFTHATAPATVGVQITARLGDDGTTEYYDTEMTELDISGGTLPAGVQIRESPTHASLGRTTSSAVGGGATYQMDSFFDIYTEVSTDGGMSWQPSFVGPATIYMRPHPCQKSSDLDGNGITDMSDLKVFAANWLWTESVGQTDNPADLNCDEKVDFIDFALFSGSWMVNCDGEVDEGDPGGGGACNTGLPGVCAAGTMHCVGGSLQCVQNVQPSSEVCNGLDDDCDGEVDEGDPGGGAACSTGLPGVCAAGTTHCVGGSLQCVQNVQPSSEVCNGLDDDCDGQVDQGDPGGGAACSTGLPGVCAAGTTHCVGGALQCVQNVQPSSEVCNGLDDDCDGQVDEGDPGGGAACNTGKHGVCAAGTTHCIGGALQCAQNVQPSAEVCNGLDDDCDGQVDQGDPGGGAACNTGLPGVCAAGTTHCVGGALQCVPNVQPCF